MSLNIASISQDSLPGNVPNESLHSDAAQVDASRGGRGSPSGKVDATPEFFGTHTTYACADGQARRRIYLDSAATTLMMKAPYLSLLDDLGHYANVHTDIHYSAVLMAERYEDAVAGILRYFNADPAVYTCLFDNTATACLNRFARLTATKEGDTVLISLMEHHSNDLPHRHFAAEHRHVPLLMCNGRPSSINLDRLETELRGRRVRYVAVTACSNVTGIVNPIAEVATLCRRYGAMLLVDGSQAAAHLVPEAFDRADLAPDAFVFAGHKAYAPGSPGVLIIRKDLLDGQSPSLLGGGGVVDVSRDDYQLKSESFERENPGTPNVLGVLHIARTLQALSAFGLPRIESHEKQLLGRLLGALNKLDERCRIYGALPEDGCVRTGVLSFNLDGVEHRKLGRLLNDRFNVAVRVGCFCAHPYVRFLLRASDVLSPSPELEKGMVRVSLGLYTQAEDIDAFAAALHEISRDGAVRAY